MFKRILKDRELNSSDDIDVTVTEMWNDLPFNDVQSAFRNWMNRLTLVIGNWENHI
jgi:hypothetical protein